MYKLYYSPGACSMAIHVVLNELGQAVTLEDVSKPEVKAELTKLNPRGAVPVLVDGKETIREGAAILLHLLEKHKSTLLPSSGHERTKALEWLMSCNATLHPAYAKVFFCLKNFEGETQQKVVTAAIAQVNKLWEEVETHLAHQPYLCGKDITVADILLTVIANWSGYFADKGRVKIGEHTKKLLRNVVARPAYQKALATENVEYKAAA